MSKAVFKEKAPVYMRKLMQDFGFSVLDAAAIMGNAGHESGGLTQFQELKPTAGRGGFGWFQWTGPRRVAYETYCKKHGYDPKADETNYKFLFVELKGPEAKAVARTKAAKDLNSKVRAFEQSYERAGVKGYASRYSYAKMALEAYNALPPPAPKPLIKSKTAIAATGLGTVSVGAVADNVTQGKVILDAVKDTVPHGWSPVTVAIAVTVVVVLGLVGWIVYDRYRRGKEFGF